MKNVRVIEDIAADKVSLGPMSGIVGGRRKTIGIVKNVRVIEDIAADKVSLGPMSGIVGRRKTIGIVTNVRVGEPSLQTKAILVQKLRGIVGGRPIAAAASPLEVEVKLGCVVFSFFETWSDSAARARISFLFPSSCFNERLLRRHTSPM